MNLLAPPGTREPRRRSTSDLFRGMTVTKALAILKLTPREYKELSDKGFREAFTRKQELEERQKSLSEDAAKKGGEKKANGSMRYRPPPPPTIDHKKLMEKSMKTHEAFQFLVKRRTTAKEQALSRENSSCASCSPSRAGSRESWASQDLSSDIQDLETCSPAAKRRGSIYDTYDLNSGPMMVGPGTPPPIIIPGADKEEEEEEHSGDTEIKVEQPKDR